MHPKCTPKNDAKQDTMHEASKQANNENCGDLGGAKKRGPTHFA